MISTTTLFILTVLCSIFIIALLLIIQSSHTRKNHHDDNNSMTRYSVGHQNSGHRKAQTNVVSEEQFDESPKFCQKSTCGAIDPVSDPDYNMKEVVKQSILLEEHLTVPEKRCMDCIAKHFLHIQALVAEALMLACDNVYKYPLLKESKLTYTDLFEMWLADKNNTDVMVEIAGKLREWRKELVKVYILQPQ